MRIAEVEEKLIQGNCTDEIIEQYKTALKKVPISHRCQHCYATAVAMKPRYFKQSIDLINYGLEFCDSWSDKMRAYYNMAIIYENHEDFKNALLSYKEALNSVELDTENSYEAEYSSHMMRMEMHINKFEYSCDLEKYYNLSVQADEFSQSFMKKMFYRTLAEIIIFRHNGNTNELNEAIEKANKMLHPDYKGPLTALLKRKGYIETIGATNDALSFLKKIKKKRF